MEIVVVWSDSAIEELREIYDYFLNKAGKKVADKISNQIVDITLLLEHTPRKGQCEEMMVHLQKEIRYLVQGNYKIMYLSEENFITILTLLDCS